MRTAASACRMRLLIAAALLLTACAALPVFGQEAQVVYLQGTVNIKSASGALAPADFGSPVNPGDTVITGRDGTAQVQEGNVNTITLSPNSVFTLQRQIVDQKPQPVLTTVLGSITFKLQRVGGFEPGIATMSTLAGARGTELTVFAGSDGSTLIAVASGVVDVQSQGRTVSLNQDEAVQVNAGMPPGEKFKILHGQLNFSEWNQGREEAIASNPIAALDAASRQLDDIITSLEKVAPQYEELHAKLLAARAKQKEILDKQGKDAATEFYKSDVNPLEVQTSNTFLNVRYWSLSALSFRQFVLGGIYLREKTAQLTGTATDDHQAFLARFRSITESFDRMAAQYLSKLDV